MNRTVKLLRRNKKEAYILTKEMLMKSLETLFSPQNIILQSIWKLLVEINLCDAKMNFSLVSIQTKMIKNKIVDHFGCHIIKFISNCNFQILSR